MTPDAMIHAREQNLRLHRLALGKVQNIEHVGGIRKHALAFPSLRSSILPLP